MLQNIHHSSFLACVWYSSVIYLKKQSEWRQSKLGLTEFFSFWLPTGPENCIVNVNASLDQPLLSVTFLWNPSSSGRDLMVWLSFCSVLLMKRRGNLLPLTHNTTVTSGSRENLPMSERGDQDLSAGSAPPALFPQPLVKRTKTALVKLMPRTCPALPAANALLEGGWGPRPGQRGLALSHWTATHANVSAHQRPRKELKRRERETEPGSERHCRKWIKCPFLERKQTSSRRNMKAQEPESWCRVSTGHRLRTQIHPFIYNLMRIHGDIVYI